MQSTYKKVEKAVFVGKNLPFIDLNLLRNSQFLPRIRLGRCGAADGACWDVLPVIEVLAGCPAEGVAGNPVVELVETTGAGAAAQA